MRVIPRSPYLAASLLLLLGCNSSRNSPTEPGAGTPRPLPANFSILGSANSTASDGSTVSCLLELFFELSSVRPRESPGVYEYQAVHGGAIQRTVLDAAGDGISLWPHVHGDAVVRSIYPDRVEISIPGNAGTGSRFWTELSRMEGAFDSDVTATGGWTCAPFDIDEGGWVDNTHSASGGWELAPTQ